MGGLEIRERQDQEAQFVLAEYGALRVARGSVLSICSSSTSFLLLHQAPR